MTYSNRTVAFAGALHDALAPLGIAVVAAELGRVDDKLTWILTLELQNGEVRVAHARAPEHDPYGLRLLKSIAAYFTRARLSTHQ